MRINNNTLLSGSVTASTNATASWLGHIVYGSVQVIWNNGTNGFSGSVSLQYTNEPGNNPSEAEVTTTTGLNAFVTESGATPTQITGSAGQVLIKFTDSPYLWYRPVWTHNAGTGSIRFISNVKGFSK